MNIEAPHTPFLQFFPSPQINAFNEVLKRLLQNSKEALKNPPSLQINAFNEVII